jgi:sugar transferase EpsL
MKYQIYNLGLKRFLDVSIVLITSIIWLPIVIICAAILTLTIGAPILFCQRRPGKYGIPFELYKFRTMSDERNANGKLLDDATRLTQFGKFLRSTSLDELPGLYNLLKGDMSLVGPRPLLMQYLERYTPEQNRRHEIQPGITGWAQVNGRNAISWEEKFQLDVWYVDNISFWLDIKILFVTVWKTIKRSDINQEGYATTVEFMGSERDKF